MFKPSGKEREKRRRRSRRRRRGREGGRRGEKGKSEERLHKTYHYKCYSSLNTLIEVQCTIKVESEHKLLPPEAIREMRTQHSSRGKEE